MAKAKRSTAKTKRPKAAPKVPVLLEALDRAEELKRGTLAMVNSVSGDILEVEPLSWVAHRLDSDAKALVEMLREMHDAIRGSHV